MTIVNLINNPSKPSKDFLQSSWYSVRGSSLKRSTKIKQTGEASLEITASSATAVARSNQLSSGYLPEVQVGTEYRGTVRFHHDFAGRQIALGLLFLDATGSPIPTGTSFSASASQATNVVTVTTSGNHGLATGMVVSLSGFTSQPALNLSDRVIAVLSPNTFSVIADDSATRSGTGGTATVLFCETSFVTMGYGEWTLASVTAVAPALSVFAILQVTLANVNLSLPGDNLLYIDNPALTVTSVPSTIWYENMSDFIPEHMLTADSLQTSPNYPLARYLDFISSSGQEILDLYGAISYTSLVDGGEIGETSALVDPGAYPDGGMRREWLPWLSQLLATKSITVPGGSTSWAALEAAYSTWDGWEDGLNAASGASPVSISAKVRTSGAVTITTSSAHGLAVGDSVVISGASTYNGVHLVSEVISPTQFTYSQVMPLLSIQRTGTSVTATVGSAHNYTASNSVVVAGTNTALDGTFSVVATSTTDDLPNVFTYTTGSSGAIGPLYLRGITYPANNTGGAGGTAQIGSDLNWFSLEQYAPYPVDPSDALAYLLRTGASGVWAGTVQGMKMASRLPLSGWDIQATMSNINGTMTVTTLGQHGLTAADENVTEIEIYGTENDSINQVHVVTNVISNTQFEISSGPGIYELFGWVTNKIVEVERGYWSGVPSTISTNAGTMTITFNSPIPFATTAAPVVITGTGNPSVDTTHNPGSVTVAANRLSISFGSAVSLGSPLSPSDARVKLVGSRFTFLVKTKQDQTDGAGIVLAFASQAKPAGAEVSHEYLP